ncbi:MAG: ADP-ribosylglycohydrolase family protein [Bacteroidales bacterium]|nr:ADP-ribosylglycohydrolase family protein [Bacteroidales bacterium]
MLGAVLGDIIGSSYEWNNVKTKDFPLVTDHTRYTDDSVMTLAVAKWLLDDPTHSPEHLISCMQQLGRAHFRAGYGGSFKQWLLSTTPQPYNSWGNGSAMRVSPVGLFADTEDEARSLAQLTAAVTHNHPEGIKGAEAVAVAVFTNRHLASLPLDFRKKMTRLKVEQLFGYDLSRTLDEIRPTYRFDVSCQGSVPEAIIAYLESNSVEDCVRNAISIGGDSDTIAAIACSIFMAGENSSKEENAWTLAFDKYLSNDLQSIMQQFERFVFPEKPTYNSYAVNEWLYAGEYPGHSNADKAMLKLRQFKRFGITHFIDLTEEGELQPYQPLLSGIQYMRFPIVDQNVPESIEAVKHLIKTIRQVHHDDVHNRVYIHCWGGVGRTGTIVACYLTTVLGTDYEATIKALDRLWAECPKSATRVSPETSSQHRFIADFIAHLDAFKQIPSAQIWSKAQPHTPRTIDRKGTTSRSTEIATPDSWETQPMPQQHCVIAVDIAIPASVMHIIRQGHIPEAMEDHWFMYCDDTHIRYYRSWTGICIYEARYETTDDGFRITSVKVNRQHNQYGSTNDRYDCCLFIYLLATHTGGNTSSILEALQSLE